MTSIEEVIKKLSRNVRRHPESLLPGFEDAGGVKLAGGYTVIKVDGFAASRALYPWCSLSDLGFRAVTAAVSDVIAKGCKPYIYAVSIGVKPNRSEDVERITEGVEEAVEFYGGYVENYDTNVGEDTWIDVFILAECDLKPIQRISKVGDLLILPKKVGLSFLALSEYSKGKVPESIEVRKFSCRPEAEPHLLKLALEMRHCINGSIDISDTLYEALQQLTEPGGVLTTEDPSEALHPLALDYARVEGVPKALALIASNEEYIPIYSVKDCCVDDFKEVLRSLGYQPTVLGVVIGSNEILLRGVQVRKVIWDYSSGSVKIQ